MSQKIAIIGGYASVVSDIFKPKLSDFGVEIISHIGGDKVRPTELSLRNGIPADCDGVIVVSTFVSHPLSSMAVKEAKRRNIPFVCVPHNWSKAEKYLSQKGIITMPETVTTFPVKVPITPPANPPKYISTPTPVISKESEIRDTTLLILEEKPNLINNPVLLKKELMSFGLFEDTPLFQKAVNDAIQKTSQSWRMKDSVSLERRNKAIMRWAEAWFRGFKNGKEPWPGFRISSKVAKEIFGMVPAWDVFKEARKTVFGVWAYEIYPLGQLYAKHPTLAENWDALAESGQMKAIKIKANYWMTSDEAVQEYLNSKVKKTPKEPPHKEIPKKVQSPEVTQPVQVQPNFEKEMLTAISAVVQKEIQPLLEKIEFLELRIEELQNTKPKNLKITGLSLTLE